MRDDTTSAAARDPREGLAAQLAQLEAYVASAEATGEEMPAEAGEMIARLREIIAALDGLAQSLAHGASAPEQESGPAPE